MLLYKQYRDYIYLCSAIYGGLTYYFFSIENKIVTTYVSSLFMIMDIVLNDEIKPDVLFHHLLTIFTAGTYMYYDYTKYFDVCFSPSFGFQISTIFLSIDCIYQHDLIKLLFILTFIYFRIYRHYIDTIMHPDYELFSKEYPHIMITPYIFFTLNMYWMCFILKKTIKSFKLRYKNTEWILQYMLCLNIPITLYKFIKTDNPYLLIDVAGHILISTRDYEYHHNLLMNYNTPIETNFLYDYLAIHAHSALTLTTYCIINNNYNVLYASVINHMGSSIFAAYITKNKNMIEFNKSSLKSILIKWLVLNVVIDSFIVAYMYNSLFNMYIILFLFGYVYNYQTFYGYSNVICHTLLICQNCLIYSFSV